MTGLRLALFDLDGTLVDSHAHILEAMRGAHGCVGAPVPFDGELLSVVGLSLPQAFARLHPDLDVTLRERMRAAYCERYRSLRSQAIPPLFDEARDALSDLSRDGALILGVATGASRRGLRAVLDHHRIASFFDTIQCADDHPSKPHPAMARAALTEAGAERGVMIGDTTYDMDMAAAAGLGAIGVRWGHHPARALEQAGASMVARDFAEMTQGVMRLLETVDG